MGNKKKKLKKKVGSKLLEGERALVVCVGDKCAPRKEARALVDDAKAYVAGKLAAGHDEAANVRVEMFGCLGVCKKGPIVSTLPKVHLSKKVDADKAHEILDVLMEKARRDIAEALAISHIVPRGGDGQVVVETETPQA